MPSFIELYDGQSVRSKGFIYKGTKYKPSRYISCTLVKTISYSSPLATLTNSALDAWNMCTSLLYYDYQPAAIPQGHARHNGLLTALHAYFENTLQNSLFFLKM